MTETTTQERTDTVTIAAKHAEILLEAGGTLQDEIASGRQWGHTKEDTRENAGDLEAALDAVHQALNDAGRWDARLAQSDLRTRAARAWGDEAQLSKAAEECSELAAAINRDLNGQQDPDDLLTELVDVRIMLWQLTRGFGDAALAARLDERLDDLGERLPTEGEDHV